MLQNENNEKSIIYDRHTPGNQLETPAIKSKISTAHENLMGENVQ